MVNSCAQTYPEKKLIKEAFIFSFGSIRQTILSITEFRLIGVNAAPPSNEILIVPGDPSGMDS